LVVNIYAFASGKGGVSKSCLTINVAQAAYLDGHNVVILDADVQRSVASWAARRDNVEGPVVHAVDIKGARQMISDLEGVDVVFVDLPGRNGTQSNAGIGMADLALIPTRPSIIDVEPAMATAAAAARLGVPYALVIVMDTDNDATTDLQRALEDGGHTTAPVTIGQHPAFPKAYDAGRSVIEHAPKSAATREIKRLWKWIKAQ